jgi:hypothetical protein
MSKMSGWLRCLLPAALGGLLLAPVAESQGPKPNPKFKPTLQPVAETKLLMEGLANPNFRGLEKLLKAEPAGVEAWTFARGQALLLAETANLLMLRPPKGEAQNVWFDRAMTVRTTAAQLAASTAAKDYAKSRTLFLNLAKGCNSCHQSFNVPVQITPFAEPAPGKDVKLAPTPVAAS